jgi:hypothetical protein
VSAISGAGVFSPQNNLFEYSVSVFDRFHLNHFQFSFVSTLIFAYSIAIQTLRVASTTVPCPGPRQFYASWCHLSAMLGFKAPNLFIGLEI